MSGAPVIGFAGLTHLGINSAAAAAARGFQVVGFDPDAACIDAIEHGRLPVTEPDLDDLVAAHRGRLRFASRPEVLADCDVVYIAVDVPTDDNGASDLGPIHDMIAIADGAMRADAILVILCQVPPGFTRTLKRPQDVLYYQVETLIFGRAVERAMYPERFIVGCADPRRALPLPLAAFLGAFDCPVLAMRYESAELAKISINMCLVASVSVANTMAEICESVGADWSEIIPSLRLDKRIGQHSYIAPGLGISGGNLERDLATVMRLADAHGTDDGVVAAWLANSRHAKDWAYDMLARHVFPETPRPAIAVLGLAYKENTHSTKNAPSLALLARLADHDVTAFDPVVGADAIPFDVNPANDALAALTGADVALIMTPWPAFRDLDAAEMAARMRGHVVIDPYGVLDADAAAAAGLSYITRGVPPALRSGAGADVETLDA